MNNQATTCAVCVLKSKLQISSDRSFLDMSAICLLNSLIRVAFAKTLRMCRPSHSFRICCAACCCKKRCGGSLGFFAAAVACPDECGSSDFLPEVSAAWFKVSWSPSFGHSPPEVSALYLAFRIPRIPLKSLKGPY